MHINLQVIRGLPAITALSLMLFGSTALAANRLPAVPFSLNNLEGQAVTLADYQGKVLLVNFWATWCPPCVHELPSMQALHNDFEEQSFEILALNMGERVKDIQRFLAVFETTLTFPILLNADHNVAKKWKVRGMPTSVVIDKAGNIVETFVGPKDWHTKETKQLISLLLSE